MKRENKIESIVSNLDREVSRDDRDINSVLAAM